MATRKVINVVSGKGGTGKTLLSAVLADLLGNIGVSVLVVDMDIYVRGLTALLYFHKGESLNLITDCELSVASLFVNKIQEPASSAPNSLGISRYRSFDVLPAVSQIDENLSFDDILPDSRQQAENILRAMLEMIPDKYDLVILDSRAGYDELIAATHGVSDASVCVEEEDVISRITADNLVNQLRNDAKTPIFRVVNKARNIRKLSDISEQSRSITDLGRIPFDIDVMNNFGDKSFWDEINRSLYRLGLTRAWNRLAGKLALKWELPETRTSAFASNRFEENLGTLTLRDRVLLIYGFVIALGGFASAFLGPDVITRIVGDPLRGMSLAMGMAGVIMAMFVLLRLGRKP